MLTRLAVAAATLVAGVAVAPAGAKTPDNWVLYELTANTAVTGADYRFSVPVTRPPGAVPVSFGALATPEWAAGFLAEGQVKPTTYGPRHVEASGPVTVSYQVVDNPDTGNPTMQVNGGIGFGGDGPHPAGYSLLLAFATLTGSFSGAPSLTAGPEWDVATVDQDGGAGFVDIRTATDGVTAGVNDFGPVVATATHDAKKGAIFVVPIGDCYDGQCVWTGTAPDGTTRSRTGLGLQSPVTNTGGSADGESVLAGPHGAWTWSVQAPVYAGRIAAGYVPVGSYWTRFRPAT